MNLEILYPLNENLDQSIEVIQNIWFIDYYNRDLLWMNISNINIKWLWDENNLYESILSSLGKLEYQNVKKYDKLKSILNMYISIISRGLH